MYDKECEAVMKIKFELRMKLNHNRQAITQGHTALSYQNENAKQRKRKERNTSFQIIEFHINLRAPCIWWNLSLTAADPDLLIMIMGGGGGEGRRSSRP